MKRGINIYQGMFLALAFGKLGAIGDMQYIGWTGVFLPLVVGSILGWVNRLMHDVGVYESIRAKAANTYLKGVYNRATARAIKQQKEEMRKAHDTPIGRSIYRMNGEGKSK